MYREYKGIDVFPPEREKSVEQRLDAGDIRIVRLAGFNRAYII